MNKVCVITGGSVGIGKAVVEQFLADGFHVYNLDLNPSDLVHERSEFIRCDVSDAHQVNNAIQYVVDMSERIDVLVSNAGVHLSANIENTSDEDFERLMSINVKGAFYLLKAALPTMRAQGSGSVILVGSDQSLVGKTNSFAYNMSKSALASMAKTTALDYAQYGIRANAVCPGTIETPLYHQAIDRYCEKSGADRGKVHAAEAALQPLGRIGQPEEVAALIAFLSSEQAKFITGSLQVIDGGYTAQ
ncbi:SDR family oxidoreductase [Neptuniibacter sp. UBA6509]|uniref:SDR family NAD(P)-dependent oxidoreductase n=3 Tax=unclassified Neptuniibacter TaxID=2630693 RepID=UPI000C690061|nr:SDR family oxidoreductase [Neptuniibacter sp. UBA6509]MAY41750.1 oxidoreductase [Oceanospirillaceae bacterium]|tara:strand:- start:18289 stop:19029 length:741 start_codon:yes stop_codon:yes gene_type:complete